MNILKYIDLFLLLLIVKYWNLNVLIQILGKSWIGVTTRYTSQRFCATKSRNDEFTIQCDDKFMTQLNDNLLNGIYSEM